MRGFFISIPFVTFVAHLYKMKYYFLYIFLLFFSFSNAQEEQLVINKPDSTRKSLREVPKQNPKAPHDWYKLYTLAKDTVLVDTSLTIQSDYKYNYLRKDNFGLLPFANDGQSYNKIYFGLSDNTALPDFGFKAKHFNYIKANEVKYYSVPTPLTELYFKTVLEQGQSLDAFITVNTSKNFNFSIAYKGLRSLGKYLNSLSSTGNFRMTSSYFTSNKRYIFNAHYVSQDFTNQENGGLLDVTEFESGDSQFRDRARISVQMEDAKAILKGRRYFVDHSFRINKENNSNNAILEHQLQYETKAYTFKKTSFTDYFGDAFLASNYDDYTKYHFLYNKLGANLYNAVIGRFNVFVENANYKTAFDKYVVSNNVVVVPNNLQVNLNSLGGKYYYNKKGIIGEATFSKGISKQSFSSLQLKADLTILKDNTLSIQYENISKVPDLNYTIFQSDFSTYNWYNNFENEKINALKAKIKTKWFAAEGQYKLLSNHLYFSNNNGSDILLAVTPKQYANDIQYVAVKLEKEIKFGRFALDNTVLFQKVAQPDNIINVPQILTRNTLYFSKEVFNKAMFLQTGVTFQYFSKHYANGYNPLIAEFYTQTNTKIGGFPLLDFFVNARVRQTRIFLKAEHFNSGFSGNNFYAAPNHPYKDFIVRFGLVWNFFQ